MSSLRLHPLGHPDDAASMRASRLTTLTALPELFLELEVRQSTVHALGEGIGYAAVREGTLVEFYVVPEERPRAAGILSKVMEALGLARAWACTFDPVALESCRAALRDETTLGYSFRTWAPRLLAGRPYELAERAATPDDVDAIHGVSDPDVFATRPEVETWVRSGWVTRYDHQGELAGFGLCTPTGSGTPACDVGVQVCAPHRRRGFGSWIVQRMAAQAEAQGLVPTAGCGAKNEASFAMLRRAGFTADHQLLQFRCAAS